MYKATIQGFGLRLAIADGALPAQVAAPRGGSIFHAVERLGLKLDSRKGPVDVIVADHVEKVPVED